jgi:hypothetical protein
MSILTPLLNLRTTVVLLSSSFVLMSTAYGAQDAAIKPAARAHATVVETSSLPRMLREPVGRHDTPLPENLLAPDVFQPFLKLMWQRSATFRRQCVRLAQHPDVVVSLERVFGVDNGAGSSHLTRHADGLTVVVQVESRRPDAYVELIAHELEHVLEQVDGVDLARLARQRLNGVVYVDGWYETRRAQSVGQTVAREAIGR